MQVSGLVILYHMLSATTVPSLINGCDGKVVCHCPESVTVVAYMLSERLADVLMVKGASIAVEADVPLLLSLAQNPLCARLVPIGVEL